MRKLHRAIAILVLFWARPSGATVEPPAVSDARSAALGGTGVAYSDNAAAVFHNPAGLARVEAGVVTLSVSPFLPQLEAPIAGSQESSNRGFFPMFLVGGAYRLNEQFVFGVAVYPVLGFGGEYADLPALGGEKLSVAAATFEASPALAYSISDAVTIGVGYRATYMMEDVHQVAPGMDADGNPTLVASDLSLSGFNFLGVHVGVLARVGETTSMGLTYRNKVTIDLDGEFESQALRLDAASEFSAPHAFKIGVAQELLDRRLMIALDLKYALYAESSKETRTTVDGLGTTETPLEWDNSLGAAVGAEYNISERGPALRLGYGLTQSATSEDYPQPFLAPPGLIHSAHAGVGMHVSELELALGGFYMWSRADVEPASDSPAEAGEYGTNAYVVALSGTYRL